jgi:hypothetical protein
MVERRRCTGRHRGGSWRCMIRVLVQLGVDKEGKDVDGLTPLYTTRLAYKGHVRGGVGAAGSGHRC